MRKCELIKIGKWLPLLVLRMTGMATVFFMLLFTVVSAQGAPTAERLSIKMENVKLSRIFEIIEARTEYEFLYIVEEVQEAPDITISVSNATVLEILEMCFKNYPLGYQVKDKMVIVLSKKQAGKAAELKNQLAQPPPIQVSGRVTNSSGQPIEAVSVTIKGSTRGTSTDRSGNYSISAPDDGILIFSFVGYLTEELEIKGRRSIDVSLKEETKGLDEVVVTALGISREKKSLGYASQQISGDDVRSANDGNLANAMSGKVSGLQIRRNSNMGGSTNALVRGVTSLSGDNQALWVVDGVPVNNSNFNSMDQQTGGTGYDFGNMASDINPNDVESINVLKGSAATALYGSRAANGAIIVTTKSGAGADQNTVTLNSAITAGFIDKSTFIRYQKEYGAGYGRVNGPDGKSHFDSKDINGDGELDLVVPFTNFASYGARFDPNLMVYQWNSIDPESPHYMQPTPWVAAKHDPLYYFKSPITYNNVVAFEGAQNNGNYRISYNNMYQKGMQPNSRLQKNTVSLNTSFKLMDRLTATGRANFIKTEALGRTGTGKSFRGNPISIFKVWWQVNNDVKELEDIYFKTGRNVTQYPGGTIDNPYWIRYENFETDERNRTFGNVSLKYDIVKGLNIEGRISLDNYAYLQEERINNGGKSTIGEYSRQDITFSELNYDVMVNYNQNLSNKLNLSGVFGGNIRRTKFNSLHSSTNGGLVVDRVFSLSNSVSLPNAPEEVYERVGVNGVYGLTSFGYDNFLYLDLTGRIDHSSTLPVDNSIYFYPSVSTSFIFSRFIKNKNISFGKLRLNYAEVGNSAPANSLTDVLIKPAPFGSVPLYSVNPDKNNLYLKPENTVSWEVGTELSFFNRRVGLDVSLYKTNTKNQIMPVVISGATGYASKFVNSGEIENRGIEIALNGNPFRAEKFSWNVRVNWSLNRNKVLYLYEGVDNLELASFPDGVTLNATVGQPYGTLLGTDFVYLNGKPLINQTNGNYVVTPQSTNVIGNVNPEWIGGLVNSFSYGNFRFNFLIDFQNGGSIFSSDTWDGYRTGLYDNLVGLNDLGNPIRNTIDEGGGIILDGVDSDGKPNKVRTRMDEYAHALGRPLAPLSLHVYDASYVKLREVALSYSVPSKSLENLKISALNISLVCSNAWIIHKNMPYSDPEYITSSGNIQGYQGGVPPTTRDITVNLKVQF